MDIDRANLVLSKAIVQMQDREIEGIVEASAYKPPAPKKRECNHRNREGDFENYDDCVAHMTKCKKMGEGDAKGLCGGVMFGKKRGGGKKSDEEE